MRNWMKKTGSIFLCLVLLMVGAGGNPCSARDRDKRPSLVFTTFPSNGMGLLFNRILVEAYARIGYGTKILRVPPERALTMADEGIVDGEAARVPVIEEAHLNLIRVPTPVYINTVVAFSKKREIDLSKGWTALAPYRLGTVRGYKYVEKQTSAYDHTLASSYGQLFAMLKNDRVDVAVTEYLETMSSLMNFDFGDIRLLSPPLARRPMYHYLHRKHADLVPRIDAELRRMKDEGRLKTILEEIRNRSANGRLPDAPNRDREGPHSP